MYSVCICLRQGGTFPSAFRLHVRLSAGVFYTTLKRKNKHKNLDKNRQILTLFDALLYFLAYLMRYFARDKKSAPGGTEKFYAFTF